MVREFAQKTDTLGFLGLFWAYFYLPPDIRLQGRGQKQLENIFETPPTAYFPDFIFRLLL